jgi:hypothetical protein
MPLERLGDALIKRLDAEIDTEADDAAALSHEQRQTARSRSAGRYQLAVEGDECVLVWQAQCGAMNTHCASLAATCQSWHRMGA